MRLVWQVCRACRLRLVPYDIDWLQSLSSTLFGMGVGGASAKFDTLGGMLIGHSPQVLHRLVCLV